MADATTPRLDQDELRSRLQAAEPGAVLVPPRVLRRAIRKDRQLVGFAVYPPHASCYALRGERALEFLERDELGLEDYDDPPEWFFLLERPETEWLEQQAPNAVLLTYWRWLFHARIHAAIEPQFAPGGRLSADGLQSRIEEIGRTAFEEAVSVLRSENLLLPPRDDMTAYVEFAAVFLDVHAFRPDLIPLYFPSLDDPERIASLLKRDVDADALRERTRPEGAPEIAPEAAPVGEKAEGGGMSAILSSPAIARRRYDRQVRQAEKTHESGDSVRSALAQTRAGFVTDADRHRAAALEELDQLVARLQDALGFDDDLAERWREALPSLLAPAARGLFPIEARLLYDLQKVCLDYERPVYQTQLFRWAVTLGKAPLRVQLPCLADVQAVQRLHAVARKLRGANVSEADQDQLLSVIHETVEFAEGRLRDQIAPTLLDVLQAEGIAPENLPERVAQKKMVEELTERVVERGFLTFSDLRDTLSRSPLKLPDLDVRNELVAGDRLLKADDALKEKLTGVYRHGEIYLRGFQRFSALLFGTRTGRFLTRFLILPFGGAFLLLAGLDHTLLYLIAWLLNLHHIKLDLDFIERAQEAIGALSGPLFPIATPLAISLPIGTPLILVDLLEHLSHSRLFHLENRWSILGLGLFFFGLIHSAHFRQATLVAWRWTVRLLRAIFWDFPAWAIQTPLIRTILRSRAFDLSWRYGIKPALITLALGLFFPSFRLTGDSSPWLPLGLLGLVSMLLNIRVGRDLQEIVGELLGRAWRLISLDVIYGMVRFFLSIFATAMEGIERLIYTVDRWLRFRRGQSRGTLAFKAVGNTIWSGVRYVFRFVLLLFLEPQINPVKHFPVVTVSHKLLLPAIPYLKTLLEGLGYEHRAALAMATAILACIPGVFGFLVWEFKENWRLYRVNRAKTIRPVIIGHHGETMLHLMKPGLHSGTLPKLFAKLRKAERAARRTGKHGDAIARREALDLVSLQVRHYLEHELLGPLRECQPLNFPEAHIEAIRLGLNRVEADLTLADSDAHPLRIAFEEHNGWLVFVILEPGWTLSLSPAHTVAFENALVGLLKTAGTDLIDDQIRARTGTAPIAYGQGSEGYRVWNGWHFASPGEGGRIPPFSKTEIAWDDWVRLWQATEADGRPPRTIVADKLFPELEARAGARPSGRGDLAGNGGEVALSTSASPSATARRHPDT